MAKGRWAVSRDKVAGEAFLVLIKRQKASKSFPKSRLEKFLLDPEIRAVFLKLCFEFDDSSSLTQVRRGLFLAIRALGPSKFARSLGVNRVSLYRMLGAEGNPSLGYLKRVLEALGLRLWALEEEFFTRRKPLVREKDIGKDMDAFDAWMAKAKPFAKRRVVQLSDEIEEDEN